MDRKKQIERKKQIQSKIRYIEGQKKNRRRTTELQELTKELTEMNSIIDNSSTSSNSSIHSNGVTSSTSSNNISIRSSGVTISSNLRDSGVYVRSRSSSISSTGNVNSYFNLNDDDYDENDFRDFFDSMADPEVANLNKIKMFKIFY